ncbi:DUF3787 domain-containing protein [Clostridium sp. MB40-C1]|uniref:DUF3787 domain-containing protein n=1 Tax=Clostridium sp. MB40-C1 TaxID=3070996 RepID=UPI0027DF227C|nr:DUF3787 domain-containing protein [Clostridium sp. MB40-C1]WMJ80175.1 DUF3787 domain-containing protein [Clostridium sp. MB40-C1]
MSKNKSKEKFMATPIEKHDTAAWANMEQVKPISMVSVPNEHEVMNAKEYVDENEK